MMTQPFVFGIPASGPHFIGREKEIDHLSSNFRYGINTVLMSPRRWGKTSLVNHVADNMEKEDNLIIIRMDIFACRSEYDFYNTFCSEILRQSSTKVEEWTELAKGFIERLIPKISVKPDQTQEYAISLGITPKTHSPKEVLTLPQKIAEKKKCRLIICIDEFQQIGEFPSSLEVQKKLRGEWQNQKNVTYCLYGSKMHMMRELFQKKSHPFYKFGEVLNLSPIPLEKWTPYIKGRFSSFGKSIDDKTIRLICDIADYQASYVQQLAYAAFLYTDKIATQETANLALEEVIGQNMGIFIEQTKTLTTYQINFLRAILDGVTEGFGEAEIRDNYNLGSPSNIPRLKKALVDKEIIEQTEKGFIIGDPILKLWLKRII